MVTTISNRKPNWPLLAGVRGMLSFCVVLYHSFLIDGTGLIFKVANQFNGFALVLSFFFISGFSISHSIHSRSQGFLMRRIQRIYPTFLVALAIAVVPFLVWGKFLSLPVGGVWAPSKLQVLASAFMLQNTAALPVSNFGPSWSLAVECAFYVCAPLLLKLNQRWIIILCGISVLFYALQPYGVPFNNKKYFAEMLWMLPALYLAWAWLLGWLIERNPGNEGVKVAAFVAPAIFVLNPLNDGRLGALIIAATIGALIYGAQISLPAKARKVALYLGDLSYPLYLVHIPTFYIFYKLTKITAVVPYILFSLGVALFVLHLVDQPFRSKAPRNKTALHS